MRVLISTRQGAGHFGPLIPFAHALLRDNDEVVVTAAASAAPMIAGAGLDHHPIPDPPAEEREPIFARARTLAPDEANALVGADLFVRIDTRAAYPHMVAAIERLQPDVMLYDISDFAAGLAAEAMALPAVSLSISPGIHMQRLTMPIAEALDEVRAEIGLAPDPQLERIAATPSFSLIPKALEDPASEGVDRILRFRTVEPHAPRPLPDWWWRNDEWPLVYLTFGTVVPTIGHFPQVYRDAIDALSVLPVRLLVTVGRECDPRQLGPVAPNVHVARWIPQADVLPHAAAVVSHGGSGTVTGSLAAGVPAVVVPFIADQFDNARRVAALGAGQMLEPDDIARLPDAVRALLADRSYREAAGRVAAEMRELPTVDTATAMLRALAIG